MHCNKSLDMYMTLVGKLLLNVHFKEVIDSRVVAMATTIVNKSLFEIINQLKIISFIL